MKKIKTVEGASLSTLLVGDSIKKPKQDTRKIKDLWEMKDEINLSPYYQREYVWQQDYKINLILSILSEVPINVIHLVIDKKKIKENKKEQYIVLDGKQRLKTIFGFIENDFAVP